MDRILITLKKENGPRASSAPALGLNTIIFKRLLVYAADSGERLQDHWSSGFLFLLQNQIIGSNLYPESMFSSKNKKNRKKNSVFTT